MTTTFDHSGVKLELTQGDITTAKTEALVTAANAQLAGGGGVDGAVHRAAGPELLRSLADFGGCPTGDAVSTPAFDLERCGVSFVIHAVGPIWRGGKEEEDELLESAYRQSVKRAVELGVASLALPSISTGVYGFPVDRAASIALLAVRDELATNPGNLSRVVFYLFDDNTLAHFESAAMH